MKTHLRLQFKLLYLGTESFSSLVEVFYEIGLQLMP
jgi:hypothetical protein